MDSQAQDITPKSQISEEQYQQIVKEELFNMLYEEFGDDILEENFFKNLLKGVGKKSAQYVKGVGKAYVKVFKAYGELLASVYGIDTNSPKAPDIADPKEMSKDIAKGDTEDAERDIQDMDSVVRKAAAKAEDPSDKEKADAIAKELDKIEKALERPPEELESGASADTKKTKDSKALLNVLDKIIDDWDKIQTSTSDKSLKKAMGYIEKVAMAEMIEYKKELLEGDK